MSAAGWLASWYWLALRYAARDLWDALPGPWWCKVLLLVLTQACPGQIDDLLLLAVIWLVRRIRRHIEARRTARFACGEWVTS